ncbi:MAG: TonB family protein [Candidatus Korobacteraceae bacterium]
MFEDCLLESGGKPRKRSLWTTAVSFALQSLAVGLLFLVPLFYTNTLPRQEVTTLVYAPPPPPPPAAAPRRSIAPVKPQRKPDPDTARLRTPTAIPKEIITPKEPEAPPPAAPASGGVVGGVTRGVPGGVLGGVLGGTGPALPKIAEPQPPPPQKIRVSSGVAQGNLIHDVRPQYPPLARQARIQGIVVLLAVIGKDGSVRDLHVKSGSPLLAQAAMDAVKQWRYRPYLLNGQPVEVDTQININFTLAGG